MPDAWRSFFLAYGWRGWAVGWGIAAVFYWSLLGLALALSQARWGEIPGSSLMVWSLMGAFIGGLTRHWLPTEDFDQAGSKTEYLLSRLPSRTPLLLFHLVRKAAVMAGLTALGFSLIALTSPRFRGGSEAGLSLGLMGLISYAAYLAPTAMTFLLRLPFLRALTAAGVLPWLLLFLVLGATPLRHIVSPWLEALASLMSIGSARFWIAVVIALLVMGSIGFLKAEFGERPAAFSLPFLRRRQRPQRWAPARFGVIAALREQVGRVAPGAILLPAAMTAYLLYRDSGEIRFPWEGPAWIYLLVSLLLSFLGSASATLSEEQAAWLHVKGADLADIERIRLAAEVRSSALGAGAIAAVLLASLQPLQALAWGAILLAWSGWFAVCLRGHHKGFSWACLLALAWIALFFPVTGMTLPPAGHWVLAAAASLPAAWALWSIRRYLRDPEALRRTLLPEPDAKPAHDEDEDSSPATAS